jgi:hypothetical protein
MTGPTAHVFDGVLTPTSWGRSDGPPRAHLRDPRLPPQRLRDRGDEGAAAEAGLEDAVVVNTCAVTAEAVRKARQEIRRLRRENPEPS